MTIGPSGQQQRSQGSIPPPSIASTSGTQGVLADAPAQRGAEAKTPSGARPADEYTTATEPSRQTTSGAYTVPKPPQRPRHRTLGQLQSGKTRGQQGGAALQTELSGAAPAASTQPQSSAESQQAQFIDSLGKALSGSDKEKAAAIGTLKKLAAQGKQSDDPVVRNLSSSAEHVLKGIELLNSPKKDKFTTFKAAMEFGMAGPDAIKAGLEGLKSRGFDPEAVQALNNFLLSPATNGLKAFTSVCQGLSALGEGKLKEAFKHLADLGESGFKTMKPFLEAAGVDKKKLDVVEKVLAGGKSAVDKIVKGLDHLEKREWGAGLRELLNAGGDTLQTLAPLLAEKGAEYAKFLGPLARSAGNLAAVADKAAVMLDPKAGYFDRLDAAQVVLPKVGVEAVRGLASAAFGDKLGSALADGADFVANKVIGYDQETGKIWREAITANDKAWNATIENGEVLAGLMGFRRGSAEQKTANPDEYMALENFAEFWASNKKAVGEAKKDIFKLLHTRGPDVAKAYYLKFMKAHRGESLIRGW
jgi:hypothetical protein